MPFFFSFLFFFSFGGFIIVIWVSKVIWVSGQLGKWEMGMFDSGSGKREEGGD